MSRARGRRTRDRKLFDNDDIIEKQEENNNEINNSQLNKIEQKQADRYDPNQLQQNVLEQKELNKKFQLVSLDDEEDEQDTTENKTQIFGQNTSSIVKQEPKRERKERQKNKIVSSDEEEIQEDDEIFENLPQPTSILEGPKIEHASEKKILLEEISMRKAQSQSTSQTEIQKAEMKKKMSENEEIRKKQEQSKLKYVLMHMLMNKAGYNKQDRKRIIYTPLPLNQHSFVYFKRYQNGFSQTYQAIGEDQRPILFSQNQRGCIGCNYYISLSKEMDKNAQAYLGKLRGNASGSTYQLFDNGKQPNNDYNRSEFRVSMAHVEYQSNFLGMKGPRKLKVIIPNITEFEDYDMYKFSEEQNLLALEGSSSVITYRNKQPKWNQRLNSYALNFGGRVKQASIKNFILTDQRYPIQTQELAPNSIVFGKIDESTFALEFTHPLSLFQAFGIALSQFDYKLTCE